MREHDCICRTMTQAGMQQVQWDCFGPTCETLYWRRTNNLSLMDSFIMIISIIVIIEGGLIISECSNICFMLVWKCVLSRLRARKWVEHHVKIVAKNPTKLLPF